MKVRLLTGLVVSVFAISGQAPSAQQAPAQPTFRSSQTLIEFTVVATDQRGNPVTDLKQSELTILDNGKPRPIAFFRFEGTPYNAAASAARVSSLSPGLFSNRSEYTPGPARNIEAIVIDSLNTRPEDQAMVRSQLVRYLGNLAPGTRVAVYRMGDGVHVIHDFTDDIASLRTRIQKLGIEEFARPKEAPRVEQVRDAIKQGQLDNATVGALTGDNGNGGEGNPNDLISGGDTQTLQQSFIIADEEMARVEDYYRQSVMDERSDLTFKSLESIGNHLAGIPGRKNLIWISGGTPTQWVPTRDPWPKDYTPAIRRLAERLATEGVAMYPVVATGLTSVDMGTSSIDRGSSSGQGHDDVHSNLHPQANVLDLDMLAGMDMFAEITGGRVSKNTNDLAEGVKVAETDMHGAYSVSFYVPDAPDNKWHDFKLATTRPGVKLLYRRGYLSTAPEKQPTDWGAAQWESAVRDPVGSTAVHMDARVTMNGEMMTVLLQIPSTELGFHSVNGQLMTEVDLALAERGTVGWSRVRNDRATLTLQRPKADANPGLIRVSKTWALNSGTSSIRLIVRDRYTGRYGVLDMPIEKLRSEQPK